MKSLKWVLSRAVLVALAAARSPYDRFTTSFAPDGQLHQIEYARTAANRGLLAVALSNGVDTAVVCAARQTAAEPLREDEPLTAKVFFVDERLAVVFSGLAADGRLLANQARLECQRHRLAAGVPASVAHIASHIARLTHERTRTGSKRLLGVECLVVGFELDDEVACEGRHGLVPRLFHTDASGSMHEWQAAAIGARAGEARDLLERAGRELRGMARENVVALASRVVQASSEGEVPPTVVEMDVRGVG